MDTEKSEKRVTFENGVAAVRAQLLDLEKAIITLKTDPFLVGQKENPETGVDAGEAIANIMLSYRATEDARMRLGKVFQAVDGGKSPLPR